MAEKREKREVMKETAIAGLHGDLSASFAKHFNLENASAEWKANLLLEMMDSSEFIDELLEESGNCAERRFAKVDRMETLFTEAFARAFNLSEEEASGPMGQIMELLESSGLTDQLMIDYPVGAEDLKRLVTLSENDV